MGIRPVRLHEDPESAGISGVVFLLAEHGTGGAEDPARYSDLLSWVAKGNTLVIGHGQQEGILGSLGVRARWPGDPEPEASEEKAEDKDVGGKEGAKSEPAAPDLSRLLARWGVKRDPTARVAVPRADPLALTAGPFSFLTMNRPGQYQIEHGRYAVLFGNAAAPAAVLLPVRRGRIVLVSDPWVFSNRGLKEPGNLEFALALAGYRGDGVVAFEERVHGFTADRSKVGYLRRSGLLPSLLQALFAAVIAVFALRGRRVPEPRPGAAAGPGSRDFLDAMGRIYAAAGFAGEASREIGDDLVKFAAQELRLPPSRPREEVLRAVGAVDRRLAGDLAALLQRAESGRLEGRGREHALVGYHNQALALSERLRQTVRGGRKR